VPHPLCKEKTNKQKEREDVSGYDTMSCHLSILLGETYSELATTRALMRPSLPALASRICRRALRASFSSNPACLAVPESSSASTSVSARVLYAAVLRMGSVVEAIVEETAAVALDIWGKKKKEKTR
jgi:hypothetical protein